MNMLQNWSVRIGGIALVLLILIALLAPLLGTVDPTLFDAANSPRMVGVRIPELVDELVAHFQPAAELRSLAFEADYDPSLELVVGDPTKLRQISYNLLSNALKYTERGRVVLSVRAVDADRWALIVEDTGPGIAPEECGQIFSEYHRAADTAHLEGTGLGLSIVKRLVDLLRGEIHLESQLGRGSRFEVILPRG